MNDKWSTPSNWLNEVVPHSGDDVVFPEKKLLGNTEIQISRFDRQPVNDLLTGTLLHSIKLTGKGYTLTGNAIKTEAVRSEVPASNSGADANVIEMDVAGADGLSIFVVSGNVMHLKGRLSGSGGCAVLEFILPGFDNDSGPGIVFFSGTKANTYAGPTTVEGATLSLAKPTGITSVPGALRIRPSSFSRLVTSRVNVLSSEQIANSAAVELGSDATFEVVGANVIETVGQLQLLTADVHVGGTGTLSLGGNVTRGPFIPDALGQPQALIDVANLDLGNAARTFDVIEGSILKVNSAVKNGLQRDQALAIVKTGKGTMRFQGTAGNTYHGITRIDVGELGLGKPDFVIGIPGNLIVGRAAEIPENTVPEATFRFGGHENIADSAKVTINRTGFIQAGKERDGQDETFSELILNGGQIATFRPVSPGKVTANANSRGNFLGQGLHLPSSAPGTIPPPVVFNVADGPQAIDLDVPLLPGISGRGSWVKAGPGTMNIKAQSNPFEPQSLLVQRGTLSSNFFNGPLTDVSTAIASTLNISGIIGSLNLSNGTLDIHNINGLQVKGPVLTTQATVKLDFSQNINNQILVEQLDVRGNATLAALTVLDVNAFNQISPGKKIEIVKVATTGSLVGHFISPLGSELVEGSTLTASGQNFTISYAGGAAGKSVELTRNTGAAFQNRALPQVIFEGTTATLHGQITEPDAGDTFFLDINWGDGRSETITVPPGGSQNLAIDHVFAQDGLFDVQLAWHDQHGGGNSATHSIRVKNVAPQFQNVSITSPLARNSIATLRGSLFDSGADDQLQLLVDWGDGSKIESLRGSNAWHFTSSHSYRRPGRFWVTLVATDSDGARVSSRLRVFVS